ncbi:EscU/YscU/HrcU family type III secretion system export apparatus switch protein [Halomonas sp. M20]|uniref:EscU/YscU/HrcU family type III secretion system export apparatus switch protein n=1 Tax=Halomonas sp. M20 TaxID=2763264 RepID=UPI001D0A0419|nr:EscU/YscU/HrcU family type III secretion system export apparatus switch protein [Halomonas sp. M20]
MSQSQPPHKERRQAVALAYSDDGRAPKVLAKGYGELAERIATEARRQGLYIHDAPELVALLMQVDLDTQIPPALYQVIAELLAWAAEIDADSH